VTDQVRSYGGKTADERAAERRARLVAATVDVLETRGVARTTMTAICAAAGLTERYFYESFANVDDALVAALDDVAAEIAELAVSTLAATEGSPRDRLHAVMLAFVDLLAQSPARARVAVVHSTGNTRLRARRHELVGMFADLVAREAAGLYGDDVWPADRARIHGLVYIAGLAELVGAWLTGDLTLSEDELVDAAEVLFEAVTRRVG
jgi:AcrR family transcriptional regulator